jgi:predicted DNA-binding transcriptional regulator YafY
MRRAERLFRLVNDMRTRHVSRAETLAEQLDVSVRTIYRDIAHLQASGLPIDGAAGVGYMLRPGFDWPAVTFTHTQLDALAVGLSFAESLDDPELALAAREVRALIQANMPEPAARRLADAPYFSLRRSTGAPDHAQAIRAAIRNRQIVRLVYEDGGQKQSARRVRPLAIWDFSGGWMFSAWCELREGFRTFRFDRIATLTLTGECFPHEPDKELHAFLESEHCEPHAAGRTAKPPPATLP